MDKGKLAKMEIGFHEECGPRPQMEDAHLIIPDLNKLYKIKGDQMALFAVLMDMEEKKQLKLLKKFLHKFLLMNQNLKQEIMRKLYTMHS